MEPNIAVLPGDGLGPEVMTQGRNVLQAVGEKLDYSFNLKEGLVDGVAIDIPGKALSYETLHIVAGYAKTELETRTLSNMPRPEWRGEECGMC
jgi:isocitrate/isopropylmalate dehydrogenase